VQQPDRRGEVDAALFATSGQMAIDLGVLRVLANRGGGMRGSGARRGTRRGVRMFAFLLTSRFEKFVACRVRPSRRSGALALPQGVRPIRRASLRV
jgi:hypothetical protein